MSRDGHGEIILLTLFDNRIDYKLPGVTLSESPDGCHVIQKCFIIAKVQASPVKRSGGEEEAKWSDRC